MEYIIYILFLMFFIIFFYMLNKRYKKHKKYSHIEQFKDWLKILESEVQKMEIEEKRKKELLSQISDQKNIIQRAQKKKKIENSDIFHIKDNYQRISEKIKDLEKH